MNEQIKEEVYKCSKCGQCQSVCPIYIATKNEMFLARGRYIVLNNSFKNNSKLTQQFIKNLDICLNCNACKRFCPSNLDAQAIFTTLKSEYNYNFSVLPFPVIYKLLLNSMRILRYIYKYFPLKSIFKNSVISSLFDVKIKRNKKEANTTKEKVVYFEGCINKYINPSDKNAVLNILESLGYKVEKTVSNCCGLPYLSDGDYKSFNRNTEKIEKFLPDDIKYIVCSCDSCYETLKNTRLSAKLIRLDELLYINNFPININENMVFHKPINRSEEIHLPAKDINTKGVCTLAENYFFIKHPVMTKAIFKEAFYKKEVLDNKIAVTTCQLALIGLKKGIREIESKTQIYSLAEYIENKK